LIKGVTSASPAGGGVFEDQTPQSHGERERTHKQGKEHAACANLRRSLACRDSVSRVDGRHPILRIDFCIGSGIARQLSLAVI
jgi:hypothetical protein